MSDGKLDSLEAMYLSGSSFLINSRLPFHVPYSITESSLFIEQLSVLELMLV